MVHPLAEGREGRAQEEDGRAEGKENVRDGGDGMEAYHRTGRKILG